MSDACYRVFIARGQLFAHRVDIVTSEAILTLLEGNQVRVYKLTDSVHANRWLDYYVDNEYWIEVT